MSKASAWAKVTRLAAGDVDMAILKKVGPFVFAIGIDGRLEIGFCHDRHVMTAVAVAPETACEIARWMLDAMEDRP